MLSRIYGCAVVGLDGVLVDVEVDVAGRGFPAFNLVGLPGKSIEEAKERVRTAIVNTSLSMPDSRITVNLAPADIPKSGSGFDMPIAVGILAASGMVSPDFLSDSLFAGELSLDGKLKKVPGILPRALLARGKRFKRMFLPVDNAKEAALVAGIEIYPVFSLEELVFHLNRQKPVAPFPPYAVPSYDSDMKSEFDFSEIRGQAHAKRALEIAACGFHNVHLKGVPGAGKTMLSRAFPSIMPLLDREEILEVTRIYSVAGLNPDRGFVLDRPFRSPHHTTSRIGLIGGGSVPQPGEISLAHRGVLFLDEFPEFPRSVLESLRQPLEDGFVRISRASSSLRFPCRFLLITASNPCRCGYLGHPVKRCSCPPGSIVSYRKRLSGPLLDRIDIHVDVPPVPQEQLTGGVPGEPSAAIRSRIMRTHERQAQRFRDAGIRFNGEMKTRHIRAFCTLSAESSLLLKHAINRFALSARSYFKIIKVSRTIADMDDKKVIEPAHVAEALQLRTYEEN